MVDLGQRGDLVPGAEMAVRGQAIRVVGERTSGSSRHGLGGNDPTDLLSASRSEVVKGERFGFVRIDTTTMTSRSSQEPLGPSAVADGE